MYRALYRKYRPTVFDDVMGQEAIKTALENQITTGKLGHAYLFTGTRGTGKTTCAKLFAKAINCQNRKGVNPCCECDACIGLENGSILDVVEIDAASNNGVDSIRMLRDETAYRPSFCEYKVYIIDEVHMLSTAAFNALLKIMEEPPSHVIFILATTEIHKVPATILSRCQRYDFLRISVETIAARLCSVAKSEDINLSQDAAELIARLADGAMRDALSLLDTCAGASNKINEALVRKMAGVAEKSYLFKISAAVTTQDIKSIIKLLAELKEKSIDVKRLTEELITHYRAYIIVAAAPDGSLMLEMPASDVRKYAETSAVVGEEFALRAVSMLAAALDKIGRMSNPGIALEIALFTLATAKEKQTISSEKKAEPLLYDKPIVQQGVPPLKISETVLENPALQDTAPWEPETQFTVSSKMQEPKQDVVPVLHDNTAKRKVPTPLQETATQQTGTAPPVITASGDILFDVWPQIVQNMAGLDRLLYTHMKNSNAYINGNRVLIQGGDMFISYMRQYSESRDKIKQVIFEMTGQSYSIGPYTGVGEESTGKETINIANPVERATKKLKELEKKGLEVEYE